MDNRLIFLYFGCFVISWGRTRFDKPGVLLIWRSSDKPVSIGKSVEMTVNRDEKVEISTNQVALSLREKFRNEKQSEPYHKPTQVGW